MNCKKIQLLMMLLVVVSSSLQAQEALKLGNRILGGGLSFSLTDNNDDYDGQNNYRDVEYKNSEFRLSPYYGRLVDDNKLLGISLLVGARSSDQDYVFNNPSSSSIYGKNEISFGAGVFIRNYFPVTDKLGIYLQPGANYERTVSDTKYQYFSDESQLDITSNETSETRSHGFYASAKVGVYLFLLDQLSIETNLGNFLISFRTSKHKTEDNSQNRVSKDRNNRSSVNFNLINQFSFDQLFTINYYF